jgi:hypothetical protein
MSVMKNEIIREGLFNAHLEWLLEDGWPEDQVETYDEAARRTESEWLEMN